MLVLQFLDGTVHVPARDDAYVRVRLSDTEAVTTAITVYLPDGTALVVPSRDLVKPAPDGPEK